MPAKANPNNPQCPRCGKYMRKCGKYNNKEFDTQRYVCKGCEYRISQRFPKGSLVIRNRPIENKPSAEREGTIGVIYGPKPVFFTGKQLRAIQEARRERGTEMYGRVQ